MNFIPDLQIKSPEIVNFIIGITEQCNFRCKYCCFSGEYHGRRSHSKKHMNQETIEQTLKFIEKYAIKDKKFYVSFYGGEALLQLEKIEYLTNILVEKFDDRIEFDVSTNGWLLTNSVIKRILKIPRMAISISIDGIQDIHDRNRIHISGNTTFNQIVENLRTFKEQFPNEYKQRIRLLMTMGSLEDILLIDKNYHEFSELLGDRDVLVSHIMPNFSHNLTYRDSYELKKLFYEKALAFEKEGVKNISVRILQELRKKSNHVMDSDSSSNIVKLHVCLNDISSCFISTSGSLYVCEKMSDKFEIGDIWQGFVHKRILNVIYNYVLRRNLICHKCEYIQNCHRCIADLNYSVSEHRIMCDDYKENIKLANKFKKTDEGTI